MDLQKQLDERGYTQAVREFEEAKATLAFAKANLAAGIMPNAPLTQFLADLAGARIIDIAVGEFL